MHRVGFVFPAHFATEWYYDVEKMVYHAKKITAACIFCLGVRMWLARKISGASNGQLTSIQNFLIVLTILLGM